MHDTSYTIINNSDIPDQMYETYTTKAMVLCILLNIREFYN